MSKYFVRTIEDEPVVATIEERDLIDALPLDMDAEDRFPFDDPTRKNIEAYKIGSHEECQQYINKINKKIQHYFKIEEFDTHA